MQLKRLLLLLLLPAATFGQTQHDRIDARGQVKTDKFINRATIIITGATPDVSNGNVFKTNNPGTVTVTNFLNGTDTQEVAIICGDTNTIIKNNANIVASGGSDVACGFIDQAQSYRFDAAAAKWAQVSGGGGGGGTNILPLTNIFTGPSNTFQNAITLTAGAVVNGTVSGSGNVGLKTFSGDAVQYVSASGNDSSDGLSPGSAKLTVVAALQALPGGSSTTAGIGTVLISGSVNASTTSNCGIWLMGSGDPNFSTPPACWLKWAPSAGQSLTFDCLGKSSSGPHGHISSCTITGGGTADSVHPTIWISALGQIITFKNINLGGFLNVYVKLGIDSNNNRNGNGGVSSISFDGIAWNHGACRPGGGPGMDIGSNSFWIWIKDPAISGCVRQIFSVASSTGASRTSNVSTITTTASHNISVGDIVTVANVPDDTFNGSYAVASVADATHFTYTNFGPNSSTGTGQIITASASAINIDSGPTGSGSGLIFIDNANLNNGGIRLNPGLNGGSMYIKKVSYEGNFTDPDMPPVLLVRNVEPIFVSVKDVEISDNSVATPGVQVDNGSFVSADSVIVERIGGVLRGRMHTLGGGTPANGTALRSGQYGFNNGVLTASGIDVARRTFAPIVVPSTNLAATVSSSWFFSPGSGTVTSVPALDGTNNAGRVTSSSGASFINFFTQNNVSIAVGDYYIFGVWARSNTTNGYANNAAPIKFALNNNGFGAGDTCIPSVSSVATLFYGPTVQADGQWQWFSGICKINSAPNTAGLVYTGIVDTTHTIDFYGPTLIKFSAGTKSDNEAWEIANNLASLPNSVPAGTVSMLRGQPFAMGVGSPFLVNQTGTLTADRTDIWPDQSGTVAVTSEPISASPRNTPPIFFPGALTTTWTAASWTLDKAITVTRVQSAAKVSPSGCSTSAIVRVTDGSTPINLTVNSGTNDSGVISQNYAAGATLTVSIQTAAATCTTAPGDLNVSIQSRMQ